MAAADTPMVEVAARAAEEGSTGQPARLGPLERILALGHGRFVAFYALVSFVILVALAGSALLFASAALRDQVDRGLRSSASASASYLDLSLRARSDVLVAFAERPSLSQALAGGRLDPSGRAYVDDLLAQLQTSVDGAYSTWLTTPTGTLLDVWPAQPALIGADFAYRDWFHGALATTGAYLSRAYVSATPAHALVVAEATRVTDASGHLLGVAAVAFDLTRLQQFVGSFEAAGGVELLVADQGGTLVTTPGGGTATLVPASGPDVSAALRGRSGTDDSDPHTLAAYAPLPWAHWALVAQLPTADALRGLVPLQRAVLLTAGVLALLNLGLVLLLYAALRRRAVAEAAVVAANLGLEAQVAQRTVALASANRELEAFSYSVSHDLRAPLRAIDGFSQILLDDHAAGFDEEGRRVLGVILRNVKQMGLLIDDLLAFARVARQNVQRAPVDMDGLARAVAAELRRAEPGRTIEVAIAELCTVPGDAALLRQVWANLLGNAIKFTRPVAQARIEVRCEQASGACRYTVRDNGVGFDPAYADNLFRPFSRLHPSAEFEGTGIGLAIVARIVARHGGTVWADGAPGQGATFGFSVPEQLETR